MPETDVTQIKSPRFDTDHPVPLPNRHADPMITRRIFSSLAVAVAGITLLAACDRSPSAQMPNHLQTAAGVANAVETGDPLPLFVPYRGLMVGIIDWSSFGVFHLATNDKPLTDSDWTAAGLAAINLIAVSVLLTIPNSNTDDQRRLADPAWTERVADFQSASVLVATAIDKRNRADFNRTADMLATTCRSCHDIFRVLPPDNTSRFAVR